MDSIVSRFISERRDYKPVWLDAQRFAFLSNHSGSPQIWEKDLATGAVTQRTFGRPVQNFRICPATREYLYTIEYDGAERQQPMVLGFDDAEPSFILNRPRADHSVSGMKGQKLYYLSNARHPRWHDVCVFDRETGQETILFQNDEIAMCSARALSPDGKLIPFVSLQNTHVLAPLFLTDTADGSTRRIFPDKTYAAHHFSWAPDGKGFYLCQNIDSDFLYVAYYDLESETMRPVFRSKWDCVLAVPSPDGSLIAVITNEDGCSKLHVADPKTGKELAAADLPNGVARPQNSSPEELAWSPDGTRLLFPFTTGALPSRIYSWDWQKNSLTRATDGWDTLTEGETVDPVLCRFTTWDGLTIPYWLYLPHGAEKTRPLPLLIEIHGGPASQFTCAYNDYVQILVAHGIAVAAPNIRGSYGYGVRYCQLDDRDKRLDCIRDIEAFAHHLLGSGLADPKRFVVSGISYGGFMTLSCAARLPKLWTCCVDIVGMFNLVSFLENTSEFRRASREPEYGYLATDREMLYSVSPIAKVDDIERPLMVVHGANDPRVPINETEQAVEQLRARGREILYLRYEDEGHGISKRKNRIDCYQKVITFILEHLGMA